MVRDQAYAESLEALGGSGRLKQLVVDYDQNLTAYSQNLPELLEKFLHKWVAYADGELSASAKTQSALVRKLGRMDQLTASILIRYVEEPKKVRLYRN